MPLFFIAIAAGAMTLGAATVDVTNDVSQQKREQAALYQQTHPQQTYQSMADCQRDAAAKGLSPNVCQQKS